MIELEFRKLLREAMNEFYKDIPDPEELEYEYTFSEKFQSNMQQIMRENSFTPKVKSVSERKYQNRRYIIRKMAIAILVAVLMLALAACTVYFLEIHWNEKTNDKQGTMDVTFNIEQSGKHSHEFEGKYPRIPDGFKSAEEKIYPGLLYIEYVNSEGQRIGYSQEADVDTMGLSIDSDDDEFVQITMNGYKGYAFKDDKSPYIIWTDGIYLYQLSGDVSYDILEKMAESIK